MAQDLYFRYSLEERIDTAAVRDALDALTEDDISVSSPITAGAPEAATGFHEVDGDWFLDIRVEGHEGDWTKTSTDALDAAVQSVEGVEGLVESEGGYEAPEDDSDEDEE